MKRLLRLAVAAILPLLALGAYFAQPKVTVPGKGKPPTLTLNLPTQPPPDEGSVTVTPGPEPWYTLFTTGEVVGYIEPCG